VRVTTYSGEPIIERLMVVPTGGLILNAQTLDSKRGMSVSRDMKDRYRLSRDDHLIFIKHAMLSSRASVLTPLTTWLLANGARMDGVEVKWLGGSMGAGLVATRALPVGTAACSVPRSLLLSRTSARLDPELAQVLADLEPVLEDESNAFDASMPLIALQLMHAAARMSRGEPSRWAPYIDALPREVNTPLLWPRATRDALLAGTSMLVDARELRAQTALELRRMRRLLQQTGQEEWLATVGLDQRQALWSSGIAAGTTP
jgi:hypothetical protein